MSRDLERGYYYKGITRALLNSYIRDRDYSRTDFFRNKVLLFYECVCVCGALLRDIWTLRREKPSGLCDKQTRVRERELSMEAVCLLRVSDTHGVCERICPVCVYISVCVCM